MIKEINRANVYRHYKSTTVILDEPIPQWVKDFNAKCNNNQ